jgi:hypothetical protein
MRTTNATTKTNRKSKVKLAFLELENEMELLSKPEMCRATGGNSGDPEPMIHVNEFGNVFAYINGSWAPYQTLEEVVVTTRRDLASFKFITGQTITAYTQQSTGGDGGFNQTTSYNSSTGVTTTGNSYSTTNTGYGSVTVGYNTGSNGSVGVTAGYSNNGGSVGGGISYGPNGVTVQGNVGYNGTSYGVSVTTPPWMAALIALLAAGAPSPIPIPPVVPVP